MTKKPSQPIPAHLIDRFFRLAWLMAKGGFPYQEWTRERLPTYPRRHAIAALWAVSAALRFSELARLRYSDVSPAGLSAWIHRSKRGIDGLVQISPHLFRVTDEWRASRGVADCPLLIPARDDESKLNNNSFNGSIARLFGTLLGIRLSSHSFRDTACQLAVAQGANVYAVQAFMGHRFAITTQEYFCKIETESLRLYVGDHEYVPTLEVVAA